MQSSRHVPVVVPSAGVPVANWQELTCGTCTMMVTDDVGVSTCNLDPPRVIVMLSSEMQVIQTSGGHNQEVLGIVSTPVAVYPPVTDDFPACSRYVAAKGEEPVDPPPVDPEVEPEPEPPPEETTPGAAG